MWANIHQPTQKGAANIPTVGLWLVCRRQGCPWPEPPHYVGAPDIPWPLQFRHPGCFSAPEIGLSPGGLPTQHRTWHICWAFGHWNFLRETWGWEPLSRLSPLPTQSRNCLHNSDGSIPTNSNCKTVLRPPQNQGQHGRPGKPVLLESVSRYFTVLHSPHRNSNYIDKPLCCFWNICAKVADPFLLCFEYGIPQYPAHERVSDHRWRALIKWAWIDTIIIHHHQQPHDKGSNRKLKRTYTDPFLQKRATCLGPGRFAKVLYPIFEHKIMTRTLKRPRCEPWSRLVALHRAVCFSQED